MRIRITEEADVGWRAEVTNGATVLISPVLASKSTASTWASRISEALPKSMVKLGGKRILATAATAIERWATNNGTLSAERGGSGIAPVRRLAPLCEDPSLTLPIAAVTASALVELHGRRAKALGSAMEADAEMAAVAVAIGEFIDFHLPRIDNPFETTTPNVGTLDEKTEQALCKRAFTAEPTLGLATALNLSTGGRPADIVSVVWKQIRPEGIEGIAPVPLPIPAWVSPLIERHRPRNGGRVVGKLTEDAYVSGLSTLKGRPKACPAILRRTALQRMLREDVHFDIVRRAAIQAPDLHPT